MAGESEFFRKQPQQSRSRSVVDAIIRAADLLLAQNGYPARLSLQGIAARAGVGIGSLYDYFADRDRLLGAVLARVTQENFEALERVVEGTANVPFEEALPRITDAVVDLYLATPEHTRGVIATLARLGWVKPVIAERDRFARVVACRLRSEHPAIPDGKAQLMAEVLSDCVMGVVMAELWRGREPAALERVRHEVRALVRRVDRGAIRRRQERPGVAGPG